MKEELKFEVILSEDDFNLLYEHAQTRDDLRHLLVPLEEAELKVSYKEYLAEVDENERMSYNEFKDWAENPEDSHILPDGCHEI
tara:strand:+ start:208 stop:459 length:252 start_codon:yes stop_codon:yes gene_type:complete